MATCPLCFGFLSDTHRCTAPRRRRVRRATLVAATGLLAAVLALLISENALWAVSAAVVGTMTASAMLRA
jgi:hypothetical protein